MLILNWHQISVQKSLDGVLSGGFPPMLQVKLTPCAELAQAKVWAFFPPLPNIEVSSTSSWSPPSKLNSCLCLVRA